MGKNRNSKIEVRRSYDVLAELDINFVFEGRTWFLRDFQFLLPERKPRFCIATAKMVEFLKVRLWQFSPSNFAFERTGAGPPGGRVITLEQRAAGMKNGRFGHQLRV